MQYKFVSFTTLMTTALLAATCAPSFAQTAPGATVASETGTPVTMAPANNALSVKVGGRFQELGFVEQLQSDPERSSGRIYLFQSRSRLSVAATAGDTSFYSQLALGGEDVYTSNTNLTLLDMYATGKLGAATWRVGQFKVPYGRELNTDSGALAFVERSITTPFFVDGRDVGAALSGNVGPASVTAGLFTGGGRDTPQRYLPEIMGIPLLTLRAGVGDVDASPFTFSQHANTIDHTRQGLFVNGVYTKDSLVGHSDILNIKNSFEKNLLLSGNYNPYIGAKQPANGAQPGEPQQGQYWQAGVDYAIKTPVAGGVLSGEAELNREGFENQAGNLYASAGRAQAVYTFNPFEVGLRYAIVLPDANMAVTDTAKTLPNTKPNPNLGKTYSIFGTDAAPIQELTPAVSYLVNGDRLKLTVDFPMLFGAPTITENGLGNYTTINQPDQVTYLTNPANSIARQFVFQIRGGLQYSF